jgi:hypothetical protein
MQVVVESKVKDFFFVNEGKIHMKKN